MGVQGWWRACGLLKTHVVGDGALILSVNEVVGSLLALLEASGRLLVVRLLVTVVGVGLSARQRRDDVSTSASAAAAGSVL